MHPISDHCDGSKFFNPGGLRDTRGLGSVVRWRMQAKPAKWPRFVPNPTFAPPPDKVAPGTAAITFIGHAIFLIRLDGMVILTDPIFSERCSPVPWLGPRRVRQPGIALGDLPRPDLVLLTHNHYDHMDLPSLRQLQALHAPPVVTTLGNGPALKKLGMTATELDWWDHTQNGQVRITCTPARHFTARTPFDRNQTLWGGFMLEHQGSQVLFAGDSGAGPHWRQIQDRLGPPDVALLPVGAYAPRWFMSPVHMDPAEAVQAHADLGSRQSVGMHYGTFQLTDEAIDAPLIELDEALPAAGIAPHTFTTLGFGETRVFPLQASR
jgi:L-ascorbate metabolism protein UlaG (beta-lactamase superfamily)